VEQMIADKGDKLSERSEFLSPPHHLRERGKPQAKIVGGLSFAYFFFGRQRKV